MALTKEERQKLDETHEAAIKALTVLVGTDGDEGLVGDFRDLKTDLKALGHSHGNLKKVVYVLIGVLVGSGILTGSILTIFSA